MAIKLRLRGVPAISSLRHGRRSDAVRPLTAANEVSLPGGERFRHDTRVTCG